MTEKPMSFQEAERIVTKIVNEGLRQYERERDGPPGRRFLFNVACLAVIVAVIWAGCMPFAYMKQLGEESAMLLACIIWCGLAFAAIKWLSPVFAHILPRRHW